MVASGLEPGEGIARDTSTVLDTIRVAMDTIENTNTLIINMKSY